MEANPWYIIRKIKIPLLFVGLAVLVFFNALFNGFVWDDNGYIITNSDLHTVSLSTIFGNSSINGYGYFYRPINALFLSVFYALFHTQSFFYHFFQICLHVINSLLLYLLFGEFFIGGTALFLALVFFVHPIQVESVAYISTLASPLAGFFGLSALILSKKTHISPKRLLIINALLVLSLLTKEDGVLYLLFLLAFTFFFRRKNLKQIIISASTIFLFYIVVRVVTGSIHPVALLTGEQSQHTVHSYAPIMRLPFMQRFINIPAIFFYYLFTFIFPWSLSVDQLWTVTTLSLGNFYFPLLIDIGFFLGVISFGVLLFRYSRQKFYIFLFFALWFFAGIGLYLQLIPLDMTVADRWFYMPIIGLLGMIGVGLSYLGKNKKIQIFSLTAAILIVSVLGIRTLLRISDYQNEIVLFSHDIGVRDNYDLEMNLGADFFDAKNMSGALVHLQKSVALFPSNVNLYDLAYVYEQTGDMVYAEEFYKQALKYPSYTQGDKLHTEGTYVNLARVLLSENKTDTAHTIITQGLAEYPSSFSLQFFLALVYYKEGKIDQAELLSRQLYQASRNTNALALYNSIKARRNVEIPDGTQTLVIGPR